MFARHWAFFLPLLFTMTNAFGPIPAQAHAAQQPAGLRKNIAYSRVNGIDLLMDACIPEGKLRAPAVIIVHGGGWVRGDRVLDVAPLFKPLSDAGFAWFSIDYRLARDVTQFGVAIDDVESAVRFVKSHAADFNVDPGRIALVGESAGGQLAAMAALRGSAGESVKAVVALYAPTDLVSLVKNSDYIPARIRNSFQGAPWENIILAGLSQLSPIDNVRRDMPPFLFIHGTNDPLVPIAQSREMCSRMREAGATCELFPVSGVGHGLRWWDSYPKVAAAYKHKMVQWLREQLGRPDGLSS